MLKVIWVIIGIFLLIMTIFMGVKMSTFSGSGFGGVVGAIGIAMLFVTIAAIFSVYIIITVLFLFIRWLIKKIKNKRKRK